MSDWQEQQHADDTELRRAALEALKAAHALGLGESECMALALPAGIANDFWKDIRNEHQS